MHAADTISWPYSVVMATNVASFSMLSVEPQRGIINMVVCCIASSRGVLFSLFIGSIATEEDCLGVNGKAVREFGRILVLIARYTNIQLV